MLTANLTAAQWMLYLVLPGLVTSLVSSAVSIFVFNTIQSRFFKQVTDRQTQQLRGSIGRPGPGAGPRHDGDGGGAAGPG